MIRLFAETWLGLTAIARAAAFREDWDKPLNLTAAGFIRSFFAAVLVLPIIWFAVEGSQRLTLELNPSAEVGYSPLDFLLDQLRFWLVFPIIAAILTRIAGLSGRFIHWVILHNWAVLFLFIIQGLIFAIYLAGLFSAEVTISLLSSGYTIFRFYIHVRVAIVSLKTGIGLGVAFGVIPVMADYLLLSLMR